MSLLKYSEKIVKKFVCKILKKMGHLPSESFSPESGGRVKPRTAIDAMRTQGTMRLKK